LGERGLVHEKDIGDRFIACDRFQGGRVFNCTPHLVKQGFINHFVDKGAFARAADSGNGDKSMQGEIGVKILQIMAVGPLDAEPRVTFFGAAASRRGKRDAAATG
jgi:hypothetical protein